jgi:hypothetical protein
MINEVINIEDKQIVKTSNIKSIEVKIYKILLFTSVSVIVYMKDISNRLIDVRNLTLEGQDYINWGNDDNYIINYVLEKLDMKKEEPIVTEEEPIVTEEEPIVTEEEPIITEENPIITEEEPIVTEENPIITEEEEPIVTEEQI